MGKNIEIQKQFNEYKKKRTLYLFFLFGIVLIPLLAWLIITILSIEIENMYFYVMIIVLAVFITYITNVTKLMYIIMQYEYFRMLHEAVPPTKIEHKIFTQSWLNHIANQTYDKVFEDEDILAYARLIKRNKLMPSPQPVLSIILIAKVENYDFYSAQADLIINNQLTKYQEREKINKLIVLQFKKYEKWTIEHKNECDHIINYRGGLQYMIHLSIGYFPKSQEIYYLRPIKRFPNKYYYYASLLIHQLCFMNSEESHESTTKP